MKHIRKFWIFLIPFVTIIIFIICVFAGSVSLSFGETVEIIWTAITGGVQRHSSAGIILSVRLPRVCASALTGAALTLCGAAMQGLLRNPLADGSTIGVSSGASLGAVLSLAFGISIPGFEDWGKMAIAMLFAFFSLLFILGLSEKLDHSLSTNTIILIGVIYSMFASSLSSLVISFAGERVRSIMFWTMGSLSGSSKRNVIVLLIALTVCGSLLFAHADELNAFGIGEDTARHVGIHVKRVKLIILIAVSILIGVCVSIGGTIGFVGLVIPHITRMITGPNHKIMLPVSMFTGASFLMLSDLISRTIISPKELSIGVVTSLIGAVVFVYVFYKRRQGK